VTSAAADEKWRVMVEHIDDEEQLLCGISGRGRVIHARDIDIPFALPFGRGRLCAGGWSEASAAEAWFGKNNPEGVPSSMKRWMRRLVKYWPHRW